VSFADSLRHLRSVRFLSQRELARQAGLHAITLVRLEAGGIRRQDAPYAHCRGSRGGARDLTTPEAVTELPRILTEYAEVQVRSSSSAVLHMFQTLSAT